MTRYLEALAIITLGITVAIIGEPRPLGLIVGAFGGITGAVALHHALHDR